MCNHISSIGYETPLVNMPLIIHMWVKTTKYPSLYTSAVPFIIIFRLIYKIHLSLFVLMCVYVIVILTPAGKQHSLSHNISTSWISCSHIVTRMLQRAIFGLGFCIWCFTSFLYSLFLAYNVFCCSSPCVCVCMYVVYL